MPPLPTGLHARPAAQRRVAGVSLLEMLLVVALIAATAALAAAALGGGFAGMQLRSAAKQVGAQLRYTRARAISTGEPQRFVLDLRQRSWQAPGGRSGELPEAVRVAFYGARQVQPSRDSGAIVFFADGASTGGRVRLSRRSAAWDVDVEWMTGRVRVRRAEAAP